MTKTPDRSSREFFLFKYLISAYFSKNPFIADLKEAKEEKELRFPITAEDFRPYGESTIAALESYAKAHNWNIAPDNREGIRISFPENDGDGWFLLRMSVHDPILRLHFVKELQQLFGQHAYAADGITFDIQR